MPKSKIVLPNRTLVPRRVKFKIGGRKSTKSALDLSTDELTAMAQDRSAGKRRATAQQVLDRRGIAVTSIKEVV